MCYYQLVLVYIVLTNAIIHHSSLPDNCVSTPQLKPQGSSNFKIKTAVSELNNYHVAAGFKATEICWCNVMLHPQVAFPVFMRLSWGGSSSALERDMLFITDLSSWNKNQLYLPSSFPVEKRQSFSRKIGVEENMRCKHQSNSILELTPHWFSFHLNQLTQFCCCMTALTVMSTYHVLGKRKQYNHCQGLQ